MTDNKYYEKEEKYKSEHPHKGESSSDFYSNAVTRGAKNLTEVLNSMDTTKLQESVIPMIVTVPMLTLRHNALRNASMDVCGVEIYFDANGIGKTPSHNREYVVQYQNLRQGFITILDDETIGPDSDEVDEVVTLEPVAPMLFEDVHVAVSPEAIDNDLTVDDRTELDSNDLFQAIMDIDSERQKDYEEFKKVMEQGARDKETQEAQKDKEDDTIVEPKRRGRKKKS